MNSRHGNTIKAIRAAALYTVGALSVGPMLAQVGGAYEENMLDDSAGSELVQVLDLDGDGFQDLAILKNGDLAVGYGHAQVGVAGWDFEKKEAITGKAESSSLESYDLDGDGNDDLIVTSYRQGTVHVVRGQRSRSAPLRVEAFEVGPGPVLCQAVPGIQIPNSSQTKVLLLAAEAAGLNPTFRLFDPIIAQTPPATHAWDTDDDEPGLPGVTIYLDLNRNAESHVMGTVHGQEFQYYSIELINASVVRYDVITLKRGYTSTLDLFPELGRNRLYFAQWAPGAGTMELVGINLDTLLPEVDDEVVLGFLAGDIKMLPGPAGGADKLLVTSLDGSQASIFGYDPVNGLDLQQRIPAQPGQSFSSVIPLEMLGGSLLQAFTRNNATGTQAYSLYVPDPSGVFQLAVSGLPLPVLPAFPPSPTVALKTADPFNYSPAEPLDFEFLSAGDFSTMASFGGGQVTATVESFLGPAQGLGDPQVVQLQPDDDPGPGGTALPNSWEASSSLVYQVAPGGGGFAAVSIDPPSGTYGGVVEVNFTAAPGTTVISRVGAGPWTSGTGPFMVGVDAVVEYYGEAITGEIGPIQSAAYDIVLPADDDSNRDGISDLIAAALGLDIFGKGDTDGDTTSDIEELLNGFDPNDPTSPPPNQNLAIPFPPSLAMTLEARTPDRGGGESSPRGSRLKVYSSLGRTLTGGVLNQQGRLILDADYNPSTQGEPPAREDELLFVGWHLDDLQTPGFSAMLGTAFVNPLILPAIEPPTAGSIPSTPYPTPAQIEQWIQETSSALSGFQGVSGLDSESEVIEVTIETTLATLAFATWARDRLEIGGRERPAFPWDATGSGPRLSRADLDFLSEPQGPGLLAHELAHVIQQLYGGLTETAAFAPLIQTAREIYLAWEEEFLIEGEPDMPVIIGAVPNPVAALGGFFESGIFPPAYAGAVTTPLPELLALRDLILQVPTARPVSNLTGTLLRDQNTGDWILQRNQSDLVFLKQRAQQVEFEDIGTGVTSHRPYEFPFDMDAYLGADAQVLGFPTEDPEEIVVYQIVLVSDLGTNPAVDGDLDGIDDRYELRYLTNLASGFWDDTDFDGFADGQEYRMGTNAGDPFSFPTGEPALPRAIEFYFAGDMLVIEWEGSEAADYAISIADDVSDFIPSPQAPEQPFPGIAFYRWTIEKPDPEGFPRWFFRVETTLKP